MTSIRADELQPGDVVSYNGRFHTVTRVFRHEGWAWPVATDDNGWAMALSHVVVDVHR